MKVKTCAVFLVFIIASCSQKHDEMKTDTRIQSAVRFDVNISQAENFALRQRIMDILPKYSIRNFPVGLDLQEFGSKTYTVYSIGSCAETKSISVDIVNTAAEYSYKQGHIVVDISMMTCKTRGSGALQESIVLSR